MSANPYMAADQVFIIMRVDAVAMRARPPESSLESSVHVLKVLWDSVAAEEEVTRLTELNREAGAIYFWKAARLVRQVMPTVTA